MMTHGAGWRLATTTAAVAAAVMPTSPFAVERLYSNGLFPAMQPALTSASNLAPIALFDIFIGAVAFGIAVDIYRGAPRGGHWGSPGESLRGWVRATLQGAWRTASWLAALYLVFLLVWGLNYRRVPLAGKLRFEPAAVTSDAARDLGASAAAQLTMLYEPAHRVGWPDSGEPSPALAASFAESVRQLGVAGPVALGRPKRTMLDWYFHRAGVDGMTDPFFLETLVATELLPFERPFVIAHEWSHLAGFADEGDANFAGWLACLHASAGEQYSGWLYLFGEVARGLRPDDRAGIMARLGPGPREDLRAVAARLRRQVNPRVSAAGWGAYDSYLKANRIEEGAASYGLVVRLVLGVQFAEGWRPLRNP